MREKALNKTQQEQLDSHKRRLEFKAHDAFLAIQNHLFTEHGECTDPQCPQSVMVTHQHNQFPTQRLRHLAHTPVDSELVERALLVGVRKFLEAEIVVPLQMARISGKAIERGQNNG